MLSRRKTSPSAGRGACISKLSVVRAIPVPVMVPLRAAMARLPLHGRPLALDGRMQVLRRRTMDLSGHGRLLRPGLGSVNLRAFYRRTLLLDGPIQPVDRRLMG